MQDQAAFLSREKRANMYRVYVNLHKANVNRVLAFLVPEYRRGQLSFPEDTD